MKKICLIADTHSELADDVYPYMENADEIWHAGDLGTLELLDDLYSLGKPVRAVYGNIDDKAIQQKAPLNLVYEVEGLKVVMTHIGGYPGRYTSRVKKLLTAEQPDLYICGHSHILKVMPDDKLNLLHINPGACGFVGFHRFRTIVIFDIVDGKIKNLNAVELGGRSRKVKN